MAVVKGSKQYRMIVVPHRPLYKAAIFCLCLGVAIALSFSAYHYGFNLGHETRSQVIMEIEGSRLQGIENAEIISDLRQQLAVLRLGDEIDSKASEDVQEIVESLQDQVFQLNEEILFYKSLMSPNLEGKGLHIKRLALRPGAETDSYNLSLLLTQVAKKHDYVQGTVEIKLVGMQDGDEKHLTLSQLMNQEQDTIMFKFRYFQDINRDIKVPPGFQLQRVLVVAQSSGRNSQRLEESIELIGNQAETSRE